MRVAIARLILALLLTLLTTLPASAQSVIVPPGGSGPVAQTQVIGAYVWGPCPSPLQAYQCPTSLFPGYTSIVETKHRQFLGFLNQCDDNDQAACFEAYQTWTIGIYFYGVDWFTGADWGAILPRCVNGLGGGVCPSHGQAQAVHR